MGHLSNGHCTLVVSGGRGTGEYLPSLGGHVWDSLFIEAMGLDYIARVRKRGGQMNKGGNAPNLHIQT